MDDKQFNISRFLQFLNERTSNFILKGGNALVQCYDIPRLSDDIDLDCAKENIVPHVDMYCSVLRIPYRVAKDTNLVKRCILHLADGEKPLKIEVSYRNKIIDKTNVKKVNGINVYSIDQLAMMKAIAYMGRDRVRDLYDLSFICNKYYDELSPQTVALIKESVGKKGIEQYDFVMQTDSDAASMKNNDAVMDMFLNMFDKLDLLSEKEHDVETVYNVPRKNNDGKDNANVR